MSAGQESPRPAFTDYEGDDADALALVISPNVQRRDLTAAQRAAVAARQRMLNGKTRGAGRRAQEEKSQSETFSAKELARRFRTSTNSIQQSRDLLSEAPDLAAQVESCSASYPAPQAGKPVAAPPGRR